MLNFTTWAELAERYPPLTDEETMAFGTSKSTVICTVDSFRVDFVHGWKRSPFNLHARDIFVQDLLQCIKGGAFNFKTHIVPLITEAHVSGASTCVTYDAHSRLQMLRMYDRFLTNWYGICFKLCTIRMWRTLRL